MLIESYDRRKERADGKGKQTKTTTAKDPVSPEVQKDIVGRTSVEGLLF